MHWVAAEQDLSELDTIAERVRAWSSRKADLFTDNHITVAWERLRSLAWVRLPKSD